MTNLVQRQKFKGSAHHGVCTLLIEPEFAVTQNALTHGWQQFKADDDRLF
jgi:hypothetical protein